MADGSITISITGDAKDLEAELKKVEKRIKETGDQSEETGKQGSKIGSMISAGCKGRTPHGVRGFRKFLQTMNILGDELGLLKRSRDRTENMILFCIIVRHACINHNLPVVIQRVNKKYNMI